jgi:hypothetical protein
MFAFHVEGDAALEIQPRGSFDAATRVARELLYSRPAKGMRGSPAASDDALSLKDSVAQSDNDGYPGRMLRVLMGSKELAMNTSRIVNVLALGLGLFSVGCIGVAEDRGADAISALDKETLDVGPGGGTNGLSPDTFHADKGALIAAMGLKLTNADGITVSAAVENTGIFNNGSATFRYAVGCALATYPANHYYVSTPESYFFGDHIMTSGIGWWNAALDLQAKKDILKCIVTRLNPFGVTVDIMLKGQGIEPDNGNYEDFTFPEAKWTVTVDATGAFQFHVWPSASLNQTCLTNIVGALQSRVCGTTDGQACKLIVETDPSLCTDLNNDGAYTCGGEDAVETFLQVDDVELLYPRCVN